jgi:hypothetical protein
VRKKPVLVAENRLYDPVSIDIVDVLLVYYSPPRCPCPDGRTGEES